MADDIENPLIPDWVVVGTIFRMYYGPDHIGNRRHEIRGFVDDHVVYRHWNRRKQYWVYVAEPISVFVYGVADSPHWQLIKKGKAHDSP